MKLRRLPMIVALATVAVFSGSSVAQSAPSPASATDDPLVSAFKQVSRNTQWTLTSSVKLQFNAYHTEGLYYSGDRIFISSVQVTTPTVKYSPAPAPNSGLTDRTAGAGIGHVFVADRTTGALIKDIVLSDPAAPDSYHPAGVDSDGTNLYIPEAEYRPYSNATIWKLDMTTLQPTKLFTVKDHIGGVIYDKATGDIIGQSWGSRRFYDWKTDGTQVNTWLNPEHYIDYQDCKYVGDEHQLCTGITGLNNAVVGTPGSTTTTGQKYEIGGADLLDMRGENPNSKRAYAATAQTAAGLTDEIASLRAAIASTRALIKKTNAKAASSTSVAAVKSYFWRNQARQFRLGVLSARLKRDIADQSVLPYIAAPQPSTIEHQVLFQILSPNFHTIFRNPSQWSMAGPNTIQFVAIPDDGDEANGQSILTYQATVPTQYIG